MVSLHLDRGFLTLLVCRLARKDACSPMAIMKEHIPYYIEVLGITNFARSPLLIFGYHDCRYDHAPDVPATFREASFQDVLSRHYGVEKIRTLDLFDSRADLRIDMNDPIDLGLHQGFQTVIDIGSIEHVFDTKQCLWNLISFVTVGGYLMIVTPCKGYYGHGLHTFHPAVIPAALELNGFVVAYRAYSTIDGRRLQDPSEGADSLVWIAAHKNEHMNGFNAPQQDRWASEYGETRGSADDRQQPSTSRY